MNTKSLSFWSDFRPHTIGFDTIFDNLDYLRTVPNNNYPPYNIRKIDEENWSVDVALAGFSKDDIKKVNSILKMIKSETNNGRFNDVIGLYLNLLNDLLIFSVQFFYIILNILKILMPLPSQ